MCAINTPEIGVADMAGGGKIGDGEIWVAKAFVHQLNTALYYRGYRQDRGALMLVQLVEHAVEEKHTTVIS